MTDEEYIKRQFETECREKKRIARGENNRVKSNRGAMKTASDYMTAKERRALSGEVVSVDLNKPIMWETFKSLSEVTQKEYLKNLRDKYGVPYLHISQMMGANQVAFRNWRIEHDILGEKGYHKWDEKGWKEFIGDWKPKATFHGMIPEPVDPVLPRAVIIPKDDGENTELAIALLKALMSTAKGAKITIEIEV